MRIHTISEKKTMTSKKMTGTIIEKDNFLGEIKEMEARKEMITEERILQSQILLVLNLFSHL